MFLLFISCNHAHQFKPSIQIRDYCTAFYSIIHRDFFGHFVLPLECVGYFFQSILTILSPAPGLSSEDCARSQKIHSQTSRKRLSRPSGRLRVVATYESLDYFVWLAKGNCGNLSHVLHVSFMLNLYFEKKNLILPIMRRNFRPSLVLPIVRNWILNIV